MSCLHLPAGFQISSVKMKADTAFFPGADVTCPGGTLALSGRQGVAARVQLPGAC